MVFVEYFVGQVTALALQCLAYDTSLGYIADFAVVLSRCDGKDGEQYIDGGYIGGLVNAHAHISVAEIAEVDLLTQCDGAYLLCRDVLLRLW